MTDGLKTMIARTQPQEDYAEASAGNIIIGIMAIGVIWRKKYEEI
jgi:hypothetical protein